MRTDSKILLTMIFLACFLVACGQEQYLPVPPVQPPVQQPQYPQQQYPQQGYGYGGTGGAWGYGSPYSNGGGYGGSGGVQWQGTFSGGNVQWQNGYGYGAGGVNIQGPRGGNVNVGW